MGGGQCWCSAAQQTESEWSTKWSQSQILLIAPSVGFTAGLHRTGTFLALELGSDQKS